MTNLNGQLPPEIEFDDMFPQTNTSTKKVEKSNFDTRNYLDFSIPNGQTSKDVIIRLLPISPNEKEFFKIVQVHNISVNKELKPNKSGKKAYMCLDSKNTNINHDIYGFKCPICEAQQEMWKLWHNETGDLKKKEIQKAIASLNVREYAIARCIERGKEDEGVKFWRIPLRQDKTDAYHKIQLLAKTRQMEGKEAGVNINILSCKEGRDLKITFTEGTGAPTVVDKSVATPLTTDIDLFNKWYYDEKKWTDVFSVKPYDYLKLVYDGEVPWFNKDKNIWVSKNEYEKNKNIQENKLEENIKNVESQYNSTLNVTNSENFNSYEISQDSDYSNITISDFNDYLPF